MNTPLTPADREAIARLLVRDIEPEPQPSLLDRIGWAENATFLLCALIACVAFWLRANT